MHTSKLLASSDFQYWQLDRDRFVKVDFGAVCPDYHELDRVGVVSPHLEDGVFNTSAVLLSLTTAFYDVLRLHSDDFFDYPQHFAFIGTSHDGVHTRNGRLPVDDASIGAAWGNLDVWPDSKWITVPGTATEMMKKAVDFQINRLFWPEDFKLSQDGGRLPAYARKMLKTRLKAIYYYDTTTPTVEIHVSQQVADLVRESIAQLPGVEGTPTDKTESRTVTQPNEDNSPYVERYRRVSVDEFLEDMNRCFDSY